MTEKQKLNKKTIIVRTIVFIIGFIVIMFIYTIFSMLIPVGSIGAIGGLIRAAIAIGLFSVLWKGMKKIEIDK